MNVQHLKLSLWWSDNDDHPLLRIHSFCRGDLKEVIKKKRIEKKKNTSLMLQFPSNENGKTASIKMLSLTFRVSTLLSITHLD